MLTLDRPLTEEAVRAIIRQAGSGLVRAKGIADIIADDEETVPVTVQYASGRLAYEKAPESDERYLVLIGTDIVLPDEAGMKKLYGMQNKGEGIWN